MLPDAAVAREEHFTYCERLYLNPLSATGPAWDAVLPARLYTLRLDEWRLAPPPPPPPRLPRCSSSLGSVVWQKVPPPPAVTPSTRT